MKKTLSISLITLFFSASIMADTSCGPFLIKWKDPDGFARVNNQKPETQKVTFLQKKEDYNNVKIQWMVPSSEVGRWLGMDFIAREGKPILNVEVIRTNMNEPRRFWTYDCVKLK